MKDKSEKAIELFNKHAVSYASKFNDLEKYNSGFDYICESSKPNAKVLDMACGPGNISKYLLTKRTDFNLLGIDLAPKMIQIAKENNPEGKFELLDIRNIKSLNQIFDSIVLGFGAPYLSKIQLQQVIIDIYETLSENGLFYLSTMEGLHESSDYQMSSDGTEKMFIYYHESNYIKQFLIEAGFKIISERQQPYIENGVTRFTDYIVIAQKK